MKKKKLSVYFGFPSYGGNGGIQAEHPDIREWYREVMSKVEKDERIDQSAVFSRTVGDTPVTFVRNKFVVEARQYGADILVMIDSDQSPNNQAHLRDFKPFWDSSFEFLYNHYERGPVVIGSPYRGPPPVSNMYVFYWEHYVENGDSTIIRLEQYPQAIAAKMRGIQECAALPTGLIMYDMRCFDLIEPSHKSAGEILDEYKTGQLTREEAIRAVSTKGWFDYEWKDYTASEKASTEDVMNTRNISLAGMAKLGYNPVMCNWDSPIGHWKPWCVPGRPEQYDVEQISATFRNVVLSGNNNNESIIDAKQVAAPDFWGRYMEKHGVFASGNGKPPIEEYDHKTPQIHLDALARIVKEKADALSPSNVHVLEVGSWKGASALAMARAAENVIVTCVDTFKGTPSDRTGELAKGQDVYAAFLDNIRESGLGYRVKHVKADSLSAAGEMAGSKFDIIFLDAEHTYEAVKADILVWWDMVADDGIMMGHDYTADLFPGVDQAVHEIFDKDVVQACAVTREDSGIWLVEKGEVLEKRAKANVR